MAHFHHKCLYRSYCSRRCDNIHYLEENPSATGAPQNRSDYLHFTSDSEEKLTPSPPSSHVAEAGDDVASLTGRSSTLPLASLKISEASMLSSLVQSTASSSGAGSYPSLAAASGFATVAASGFATVAATGLATVLQERSTVAPAVLDEEQPEGPSLGEGACASVPVWQAFPPAQHTEALFTDAASSTFELIAPDQPAMLESKEDSEVSSASEDSTSEDSDIEHESSVSAVPRRTPRIRARRSEFRLFCASE